METLLITTSTFPRWKNDALPSFVYDLAKRLTKYFNVIVLAPHSKRAKIYEEWDKIKIYRYRYFFESLQRLGDGAILPNLKKNPFLYIQLFCLLIAQFFSTLRIVKKEGVDKIQAHWIIPQGIIASSIKKLTGKPHYIVSHGGDIFGARNSFFLFLKGIALRNSAKVAAVSEAIKSEIKKLYPNCKIDVIPMGTSLKDFSPKRYSPKLKKRYGIKGPFLLFVGRISEKKGLRYLLEAIPRIKEHFPKAKLIVIGEGEEKQHMQKLSKKLNLNKYVSFIGSISHKSLPEYYATADIFIGPSIQSKKGDMEGFGLVFTEAMSSGTVAICTDLPAMRDIIKDNKTGFVVKQKNSEEIAKKVIKILKNKKQADKIAKAGMEYVKNHLSWDIVAEKYHKHLR